MTSRRHFLGGSLAVLSAGASPRWLGAAVPRFDRDPFTLGVASGYPTDQSVVLWTRLAPSPLEPGGGVPPVIVPVEWEIAADDKMQRIVQRGTYFASPDWAHSVHVEPAGLEPAREYWYRFIAGGYRSPIGRTYTAPRVGAPQARLRIAVASCQQYEHGYYTAYRQMMADNVDLIVHTGDYIYEMSWGESKVRAHGSPECYTLEDYRARYALYKSDPHLAAAHASCPWLVTWDDHEVDNDYAGAVSEENDPPELFLARRAAAYRAYYEHMPLPRRAVPSGAHMRLYAQRAFGDLVALHMLDQRQYRSPIACPPPGRRGAWSVSNCPELQDSSRTKLGAAQEEWLFAALGSSRARWNLLAQGTVMAHIDEDPGPGHTYWTDGWNGYPAARDRLVNFLAESRVRNPVVLSGDIHAFIVSGLRRQATNPDSPVVAPELVTTSITSDALPQERLDEWSAINPNLQFASSEHRGYLRLDVTPTQLRADLIAMESVKTAQSAARAVRSFVIEDGRPLPVPA